MAKRSSLQVNVHEAKTQLSKLFAKVEQGEEVVIARDRKPIAKLVPFRAPAKRLRTETGRGESGCRLTLTPRCPKKSSRSGACEPHPRYALLDLVESRARPTAIAAPRKLISNPAALVLSSACVIEIAIKHAVGKLKLDGTPADLVNALLDDGVIP